MDEIRQDMHSIREAAESEAMRKQALDHMNQDATAELDRNVKLLLDDIAHDFVGGDKNLHLKAAPSGSIGFIIHPSSPDASQFVVSAVCKEQNVTISVTDGKWEEVHGGIGNWGEWTDDKPVYSGPLDDERIRRNLSKQFLPWYKDLVGAQPQ